MFAVPTIGSLALDRPFCQAGLAGYSDRAMRVVARRRGCPYAVTEALPDSLLLNGGLGLRRVVEIADDLSLRMTGPAEFVFDGAWTPALPG